MWSDGISFACTNSIVRNNTITDAFNVGIVVHQKQEKSRNQIVLIPKIPGLQSRYSLAIGQDG
jgi:hypothetical protein